jgi:hypothetical protein
MDQVFLLTAHWTTGRGSDVIAPAQPAARLRCRQACPFLLPLAVEVHDHVVFAAEQDPAWWLRVVDYGEYRLGDPGRIAERCVGVAFDEGGPDRLVCVGEFGEPQAGPGEPGGMGSRIDQSDGDAE